MISVKCLQIAYIYYLLTNANLCEDITIENEKIV